MLDSLLLLETPTERSLPPPDTQLKGKTLAFQVNDVFHKLECILEINFSENILSSELMTVMSTDFLEVVRERNKGFSKDEILLRFTQQRKRCFG